ncbi:uncharacterized protein LOC131158758 [Malania oleifera]|uniref:uncharacterized protein LOC131158758 n=1 Tax=Malania oleifera TaxID=397392 RepID=UPI0025AE9858|nr:uncharacterized protein LOC131158758 [Malania oleifera]
MGQVKILKRGEKLSSVGVAGGEPVDRRCPPTAGVEEKDLVLSSTERLGPEPDTVQKQIRVSEFNLVEGIFSGSAAVSSPPPSSLPFPAFFAKKEKKNDIATSDLRRLLRLDVV